MKKTLLAATISSIALSGAMTVQAQSMSELVDASSLDINLRYRVESVDQDNSLDNALANTLKSRITLKTGEVAGLSVLVEGDNVLHVTEDFNSSENGEAAYSLVKDPETTQLNQAYLQYKKADTTVKLGNQRINLDNQRHVGGVGFRQDEATFDAVSVISKAVENTTIFVAVANNRNSITNTNTEEDITLLNVKYAVSDNLAVTGYFYGITDANDNDLDTIGVRAVGTAGPGIKYEAEFASQDSSSDTSTTYYNLSAGKKLGTVMTKIGYEVMGSDGGTAACNTPRGTNHKFLGWSDAYLSAGQYGTNGIQDLNLSAVTKVSGVKLVAQLHKFDAVEGSNDLGTEIGFLAAKKIKNYGISVKVAQLTGSDTKDDTTKLWLTGTAKF